MSDQKAIRKTAKPIRLFANVLVERSDASLAINRSENRSDAIRQIANVQVERSDDRSEPIRQFPAPTDQTSPLYRERGEGLMRSREATPRRLYLRRKDIQIRRRLSREVNQCGPLLLAGRQHRRSAASAAETSAQPGGCRLSTDAVLALSGQHRPQISLSTRRDDARG